MGNLCGGGEGGGSANKAMKSRKDEMRREVKLLLLGSGESGKSTFFKQIKIIHSDGYSNDELYQFKSSIYANILTTMKALTEACQKQGVEFKDPQNKERAQRITDLADSDTALLLNASQKYTIDVAEDVEHLWADESVKEMFNNRYNFHVFDGAEYFFSNLERLRPPHYVPTSDDILRCRRKTTGIIEISFSYGGHEFKLFDVGGQRNERKKWIHCFEGVTAVVFVASLSDYDQKCYEDDRTNRMQESLDLFDEICNGNWFKNAPIFLFLNKQDIFRQKIKNVDLKVCFPDYDGGQNFDNAIKFIETKFLDTNKFDPSRIFTQFTEATDTTSVEAVFENLKNTIIEKNLVKQPV